MARSSASTPTTKPPKKVVQPAPLFEALGFVRLPPQGQRSDYHFPDRLYGDSQAGLWAGTGTWGRSRDKRTWLLAARKSNDSDCLYMRANSEAELFALCTAALLRGDIMPFSRGDTHVWAGDPND